MLDNRSAVPVWPAVTLLTDVDGSMTLNQAQAAAAAGRFTVHGGTPSSLGRNANTVWLRFVIEVPGAESVHRALALDYPSLNRIDLHILKEGVLLETMVMSNQLGLGERLTPARAHVAPLYLLPGRHEMLLRVHTQSSLVLPTTLRTPEGFTASESRAQTELGIVIGLALCMLLYSLNDWLGLRDPLFLDYAGLLAANMLFVFAYFGLGAQYL